MTMIELAGAHCVGKTTLCNNIPGCKCVHTITWHCTLLNGPERQSCFVYAIEDAYCRAWLLRKYHRCVIVDNSLLSVIAYSKYFGLDYSWIVRRWKEWKKRLDMKTILVVETPEKLRKYCKSRRGRNWEWEVETTSEIQSTLLSILLNRW